MTVSDPRRGAASGPDPAAPAPVIVLVAPQMGENIGAAARAMWNFGLRRLRIVAPRDGWPNPAATAMASGAGALLDDAQVFATTAEAVADCTRVYATTARPREMTKRVVTPERAMAETAARLAADPGPGARTAILFGPERAGLANEDVLLADTLISVPVNPAFPSLNLAQCVLLVGYEWRRAAVGGTPEQVLGEHTEPAPRHEVSVFLDGIVARLDEAGFFYPEDKRPAMTATLANLMYRMPWTRQDVRTLWGVMRALADLRRRKAPPGG